MNFKGTALQTKMGGGSTPMVSKRPMSVPAKATPLTTPAIKPKGSVTTKQVSDAGKTMNSAYKATKTFR